jgi:putative DNA primase/helicase
MAEEPSSPRPGRIGPRPAHLGPYLGPGLGFTAKPVVSAATAGRLGRRSRSADATPGNSIGEPATLTLADLANHSVWVGWRQEMRNGRSTKIPYDPKTGRLAASDNASTWATRDQAERWANCERADGVGIMLSELDGGAFLCGVDLDTCRSPESDDTAPWAQEIIDRFMTYTEVSPSGTGAKLFFTVASGDLAAVEALFEGKHGRSFKNGGGEHPPAIEIYRGRRYFTVTGKPIGPSGGLRSVDLSDLQWLIREAGPRFGGKSGDGRDDSRSAKAWRSGAALKASGASYEAMRDALLEHKDPDIAGWARTKGTANGEREMRRIFDKSPCAAGVIDTRAPYDTARLFQSRLATPLRCHRSGFYAWDGCAWREADEAALRARLYSFLDECQTKTGKGALCPVKPNAQMVGSVLDALRAAAHLDAAISPPAWLDGVEGPEANTILACANGLLHLPTLRLLLHTPSFFTHNALDFAYDPHARQPEQWFDFLDQLWPGDPESIATLQEIFGYCLTPDTRQQKAFMMVGPRRSGKGTIGRVLTRLIGEHNCVSPTLAGLGTNFGLAPLIGKQLAIISDARLSGRVDQHAIAERLLSITGEDALTIDRKYAPAWTGQLRCRFLILSNELPRLADVSGALAGRFILLLLRESFYGREDQDLTSKLLNELPGILNWAIAGWAGLASFGRFRQPTSATEAVEQLEDLSSPISAFVRERCEIGAAYSVSVIGIFNAWTEWCMAQGREHAGTAQSFGRDLRAAVPGLKTARPREGGGRVREYQGLRLTPP